MQVSDFYNQLPYPLRPRPTTWARALRPYVRQEPERILHAGCATGSQTRALAYEFPDAEIVAVDFADSSLAIARRYLDDPKMQNVRFERADLTRSLDHYGKFDLILSYGVLHHIPAVDDAVQNIRATLRDAESAFVIFVYGKYGRSRIAQLQEALSRWQAALPDLSTDHRLRALWRVASANGTFSRPRGWMKYAMVKLSRRWRDGWTSSNADAYLHPFVRYYDLEDLFALLSRHGLSFDRFIERPRLPGFPARPREIFDRYGLTGWDELPERERMLIVDRLAAPKEYEFVCRLDGT